MAGTDPKNIPGPGQTSATEGYDADEDPLVELARIVSEDGGFSGRKPTPRPRPSVERVERAEPLPDRNAFTSDLEAELMQELETSFSAPRAAPPEPLEPESEPEPTYEEPVREEPIFSAPPRPARPPEPRAYAAPQEPVYSEEEEEEPALTARGQAPAEPEPAYEPEPEPEYDGEAGTYSGRDDPDDLLRSIERQLSQFEQRVRSDNFAAGVGRSSAYDEDVDWSGRGGNRAPTPQPEDDWQESPQPSRPEYSFRGPAAPPLDLGQPGARRPREIPTSVAPAHHAVPDEDDYAEQMPAAELDETGVASESAARTPGERDFASLEEELTRELDTAYAAQQGASTQDDDQDEDEEDEDDASAAAAAVIAPAHGMRPPPRPAPVQRSSSRGTLFASIFAILIVAAIGGGIAYYLRATDQVPSGPPPVIAAPDTPVKIEPAPNETAAAETPGEAVYDQVAGRAPDQEETLVEGAEEPQDIERIVLPETQNAGEDLLLRPVGEEEGAEGMATEGESAAGPAAAEEEFGPRQVPTYVVRADGSIVATSEAEGIAGEPDTSAQEMMTAQTEAIDPTPVETVVIDETQSPGTPPAATGEAEGAGAASTEMAAAETPAEAAPEPPAEPVAEAPSEEEVAAAEPPPAATPPPDASGFLVQLSAQTSQEAAEATYAGLQRRYPSILGSLGANIQRADLDSGTFYRVRVGPWEARDDAVEVCEALKAAGADCYVTR